MGHPHANRTHGSGCTSVGQSRLPISGVDGNRLFRCLLEVLARGSVGNNPNIMLGPAANTLGALIRSKSLTSFNIVPDSVISLWIERCAANGIKRLMIFDALHDWNNLAKSVSTAKKAGIEVWSHLSIPESGAYDEFYAQKAQEMIQKLDPHTVMIKDSIGLLTPERTKTLVPTVKKYIGDRPLEMHSHCTTGLAPLAVSNPSNAASIPFTPVCCRWQMVLPTRPLKK